MKVPKTSSSKIQAQVPETKHLGKYALQSMFINTSLKLAGSLKSKPSSKALAVEAVNGVPKSDIDKLLMAGLLAYLDKLLLLAAAGKDVSAQIKKVEAELRALAKADPDLSATINSALNEASKGYAAFQKWFLSESITLIQWFIKSFKEFANLNLKNNPELVISIAMFFAYIEQWHSSDFPMDQFFGFIGSSGSMAYLFAKAIALYFYKEDKGDWSKIHSDLEAFIEAISTGMGDNDPNFQKFLNDLKTDFNAMFPGDGHPASSGKLPEGWDFNLAFGDFIRIFAEWIQSISS